MSEPQEETKVLPNDPRMRLKAQRGSGPRKGAAIAAVALIGGTITAALIASLVPNAKPTKKAEDTPAPAATPPVVPEVIRNAPEVQDRPRRHPPPATDRLLVVPLPDGGIDDEWQPRPMPARAMGSGRNERAEQEQRARGAGILFGGSGASGLSPATSSPPSPSTSRAPASSMGDSDPNMQSRKLAFLDEQATKNADILQANVEHPRSPFEVQAGTIVPAVIITAINSDLPGPVIGQVREDVYDSVSGNFLLIPQGARLLAHYDSMVAWGQERVLVCWNRIIFPNGDSIHLECMPAADLTGAAGLADDVNEHWARIIKGAAVATLLGVGTQMLAGNPQGASPTLAQTWAAGAATQINQVGQNLTQKNIQIQPTITVRAGFSVNVIVTKDLVFPGAYQKDF